MDGSIRLLVIEDFPADFLLVERHLARQRLDARCHRVASLEDLRQALDEGGWDAVLSDYGLPDMAFTDVLDLIRGHSPDLPVLLLSGTIGEEAAVEMLKSGVTDFVLKDNLTRLVPAIRRAVSEAAESRALRAAEQELRERELRYARLVEATFDCIWETDQGGRLTWISPRITALTGRTPDELIGTAVLDGALEDAREDAREDNGTGGTHALAERMAAAQPFAMVESRIRHRDGSLVVLENSGLPILLADGSFAGYLGASRDVTAQRQAEAAIRRQTDELRQTLNILSQTNTELERLTFAASHDLQEPVRNVVSFAQLLERRLGNTDDQEIRDNLRFMVGGAYRMRDMILGLMRLAAIPRSTAPWVVQDCATILEEAQRALAEEISRSGAMIDAAPLPRVMGDAGQLRELFACLLSNALRFTRPGVRPTIRVTADAAHEGWHFAMADNGCGIAPEYIDQMFQPFRRLHADGGPPGAGMGLAIARRIVDRHGGRIWADSIPGQGTTISFTLPSA